MVPVVQLVRGTGKPQGFQAIISTIAYMNELYDNRCSLKVEVI
jgi:hypothetical protein